MSLPPVPYDRLFNFETFSTTNPTVQQPGVQIDGEFDALKLTVDSIISRLAEVQRSDGKLNPQAFDDTGIAETIATDAYSQVYAQLQPLVSSAAQSALASSSSASVAGNYANAAQAHATAANAAIAPAVAAKDVAVTKASEAQAWATQANAAASSAASAEVEAEAAKDQAIIARDGAEQALSSVNILKNNIDNQYGNLLDADQNLSDVSSKTQSITNLGLDAEDAASDLGVYNRFKMLFGMYVDPNEGNMVGYQDSLSADDFLKLKFGLKFNVVTNQFENAAGYNGTYFGSDSIDPGYAEDNTIGNGTSPTSTLAHRLSVLKKRLSVVTSIFRTTLVYTPKTWGYNGSNQVMTWQDFDNSNGSVGQLNSRIWSMVMPRITSEWWPLFDAPNDGKQYARQNLSWTEVVSSGGGVSEYDNFKVYNANDVVWLGSFIYRFNAYIGAAGYGPVTHPAAWTKLSASVISDITNLQSSLDAKATTVALASGLAGKANTTHTHTIANISGLQTELNGKSSTSHTHDVLLLTNSNKLQRSTLPVINQSYQQQWTVTTPGALHVLDYATDENGKVTFGSPWYNYGERFFFYQSVNATYPMQFTNAINIDGKTFTRGAKSYVEAVCTPDGWVVSGDLMFPPSGTILSSSCDYVQDYADAEYVSWSGNFYSNITYADGNGGSYSGGGYNMNGCWYPYGFCIQFAVTLSESTVSWSGCSSSGTTAYSIGYGNIRADGTGGTYQQYTGGWSANYGDLIYENGNTCSVRHDGMGGYYVEDTSSNPSYGSYIGQGSGNLYTYYGYNIGDLIVGTYTNDQYADGNGGVAYTDNQSNSYYGYGTYLAYDDYNGISVYSDGYGGYYTS